MTTKDCRPAGNRTAAGDAFGVIPLDSPPQNSTRSLNGQEPVPDDDAPMVTWALWYAARGFHIFPLRPASKEPYAGLGVYGATTDAAQIRAWWTEHRGANIGLHCGASGLVAFDLDRYKDIYAGDELEVDEQTWTSITGRGGTHLFYRLPAGKVYGNLTGELPPGVDVKCVGGYVVLPPSVHPDTGREYAWELDYSPADRNAAPLPAELERILDAAQAAADAPAVVFDVDLPRPDLSVWRLPRYVVDLIHTAPPVGRRSDEDWRAVRELIKAGFTDDEIRAVFQHFPIGGSGKYAERGDAYLARTIGKARGELGYPVGLDPNFAGDTDQTLPGVNIATPKQIAEFIAAAKPLTGPAREAALGVLRSMLGPLSDEERQACESPLFELFKTKRSVDQFLESIGPAEGNVHGRFPFLRDVPAEEIETWLEEWRQASAVEGGRSYGGWEFIDQFAEGEAHRDVVPDLLPRGEVWTIAGKAGAGKSWLHARLATELATGSAFLGRYDVDPGRVLCCLTEGKGGWARRLRAHLEYFQAGRDDCGVWVRDNLPQLIEPLGFGQKAAGGLDWFLHIRRDMWTGALPHSLDLVLIDYLREASIGALENSNDDMSLVLRAANQLARALDCGIILFHHRGDSEFKAFRGATAVRDMSFALLTIAGDVNGGQEAPVKLEFDKAPKDCAEPAPVFVTLDTDWPGYPVLVYVDHEDDLSKQIYELLRYEFPGDQMTHTQLAGELISPDGVTVDNWKDRVRRACIKMRKSPVDYPGITYEPGRSGGYQYAG